jgi:hypothetical protein
MISVTLREIEKSFRRHRNVVYSAHASSATHRMVLFYAVECGLKAVYMRRNRLRKTDGAVTSFGHRLADLLASLRCTYRLRDAKGKDGIPIPSKLLHEAWRYGKALENQRELSCETSLKNIILWINNELEGGGA